MKTPATPASDALLDDKLSGYVNPPKRDRAIVVYFKGSDKSALLTINAIKAKHLFCGLPNDTQLAAGMVITAKHCLHWTSTTSDKLRSSIIKLFS